MAVLTAVTAGGSGRARSLSEAHLQSKLKLARIESCCRLTESWQRSGSRAEGVVGNSEVGAVEKIESCGQCVLDFVYDAQKQTLSREFTRNNRHGIWEFSVKGDMIEGTLTTLPDKSLVRRVKVQKDK